MYVNNKMTIFCVICGKKLTIKTVYSGFMGTIYRLIFWYKARYDYKQFSTCQNCRDLRMSGYTVEEIRENDSL